MLSPVHTCVGTFMRNGTVLPKSSTPRLLKFCFFFFFFSLKRLLVTTYEIAFITDDIAVPDVTGLTK